MINVPIEHLNVFFSHLWVFLTFPVLIGFVFFVHELGHYATARFFNTHVEKFSVGFGKKIVQWTDKHDTKWSISILPLGGYVKIDNTTDGKKDSFSEKEFWQKITIIAAGPVANFLLCFVFIFGLLIFIGAPSMQPVISAVEIDSPADKAGFKPEDKILLFEGRPVTHFKEVTDVTTKVTGRPFSFVIERNGEEKEIQVISEMQVYHNKDKLKRKKGMMGVMAYHEGMALKSLISINGINVKDDTEKARDVLKAYLDQFIILHFDTFDDVGKYYYGRPYAINNQGLFDPQSHEYNLFYLGSQKGHYFRTLSVPAAFGLAVKETGRITYGTLYIFSQIFRGQAHIPDISKITPDVSVKNVKLTHEIVSLFYLAAMVSVIMGFINLLPFPIFDGGHILRYTLIERRKKKKMREQ